MMVGERCRDAPLTNHPDGSAYPQQLPWDWPWVWAAA